MLLKTRLSRLATVLAVSSLCATNVFAAATATPEPYGTVDGTNYVEETLIDVTLPGDLMFGINPLQRSIAQEDGGSVSSQIITGQYEVINNGNTDVAISVNTGARALPAWDAQASEATKADLLGEAVYNATTKSLSASSIDGGKAIWLNQMLCTSASVGTDDVVTINVASLNAANGMPVNSDVGTKGKVLSANTIQNAVFVLDARGENLVSGNVSGFKFDGRVDPNADFQNDDVCVRSVFDVKAITSAQKTSGFTQVTGCAPTVVTSNAGNGIF